jgi:hypothetical protein
MRQSRFFPKMDIRALYDRFNAPMVALDCGKMCAPYNPSDQPFCCDICHAVPAAYAQEWGYLRKTGDLWHVWRGDECSDDLDDPEDLRQETPEHMLLLACKGAVHCHREYRALSCRQFPFFPYISSDYRFLGLAYEWPFEKTCWVISSLSEVTTEYRAEFIRIYDHLFALWQEEFDSYVLHSEKMRDIFMARKRRIPILHRNGKAYLISPKSERLHWVDIEQLPKFGPYKLQR